MGTIHELIERALLVRPHGKDERFECRHETRPKAEEQQAMGMWESEASWGLASLVDSLMTTQRERHPLA